MAPGASAGGLPAFGFASSTAKKNGAAGQLPDDDVLLWAGVECGAEFWIVPDNDPPGRKAGAILARRLQQLRPGIPVRWVDPSKLVKAPANGWDLADWIDPPADAAERIRAAIGEPPAPPKAATAPPAPPTGTPPASGEVVESEHHLAELFARERGGQWRCQIERDLWLEWRGAGWEPAFPGHILDVLGLFGRERLQRISKGEVVPDPRRGGKLSTVTASAKYARAMKPIATRADDWDATPDLIGLPGNRLLEVVDGKLVEREGTREDLVSKALSARPAAPSEWRGGLWAQHLEGLFDDPAMAAFLQSLCGYSVLGRGTEHKLVLCPGRGGTGKTVTFSAIAAAAGDYGEICNPAAITSTRGMPTHPVARTAFIGRRVVVSPELDSGAVLDCAFTKRLSGGDVCTARGMRENETKFVYRGLLFIHTNAEPQLLSPDSGLKRRLVVLPFARIREHPDVDFLSKIDPSHVAAWLVEGAAHYLAYGLMAAPPAVVAASRAFHEYADPFSSFVDRWLTLSSTAAVPVQDVYERYQQHCRESGQLKPATSRTLLKRLREGGFGLSTDRKTMGVQWLDGASLLDDREAA